MRRNILAHRWRDCENFKGVVRTAISAGQSPAALRIRRPGQRQNVSRSGITWPRTTRGFDGEMPANGGALRLGTLRSRTELTPPEALPFIAVTAPTPQPPGACFEMIWSGITRQAGRGLSQGVAIWSAVTVYSAAEPRR